MADFYLKKPPIFILNCSDFKIKTLHNLRGKSCLVDPHRPLVQTPRPQTALPLPGDVSEDDWLCRRLTHCTFCGREAAVGDQQCVVYLPGRVVAALHCRECRRRDPVMQALHAMLLARYGGGTQP